MFHSAERLQQNRLQPQKVSWVLPSVKVVTGANVTSPKPAPSSSYGEDAGLGTIIIPVIFNDAHRMIKTMMIYGGNKDSFEM